MLRVSLKNPIWKTIPALLALSLTVVACSLPVGVVPTVTPAQPATLPAVIPPPTETSTPAAVLSTPTDSPTVTPTDLPSVTPTALPSATPTSTAIPTETAIPACELLRGVVTPEKVACKDGPGAMYLFVYGLNQTAVQDLIGRNDLGSWLLTRSHGDSVSCWVKTDFLKINADPMCLPRIDPDNFGLPRSPYYRPPTGVNASRKGDLVTVSWNAVVLRAGDDSLQTPYVVEAWVCRSGRLLFEPTGAYTTSANIRDEAGCAEPSHGRVMAVEKHGFTLWVQIPWPQAPKP